MLKKQIALLVVSQSGKTDQKPKSVKSFLKSVMDLSKGSIKFAIPPCCSFKKTVERVRPQTVVLQNLRDGSKIFTELRNEFPETPFFSVGKRVSGIPDRHHFPSWQEFTKSKKPVPATA